MVKVTLQQLAKITKKLNNKPDELRALLKHYFSFEYNIAVMSQYCFPVYIQGDVPDFHQEFYDILNREGNNAFGAPRGHAKSTTVGLVYLVFCVVNKLEPYIVYISQNHAKTTQFITPLRWEFKTNIILRFIYGDLSPSLARDDMNKDREDCIDVNGTRIEAVSFEKNMRGFKYKNMRPTLIIGDDIEDDARVINPLLRQKDEDKLTKIIIPSLDINGRFKMIGTILHLDSLLMKRIARYGGKIYKAIDSEGNLLWPERFTQEKLDDIKYDIGSAAFQQEYLNDPVDNASSTIKREWCMSCIDYEYSYDYEDMDEVYLAVDFAFSDRITADSSAFMDIGIKRDRFGNVKKYILNILWKKGMSILEQFDLIKQLHYQHDYTIIALEENSIKSVSSEVKNLGLPIKMFWTGARDTKTVSVSGTKSYSKENAIERLAVEFENTLWAFPYRNELEQSNVSRLIDELTSWAKQDGKIVELGAHPDAPICMLLINEALNKPKYGMAL